MLQSSTDYLSLPELRDHTLSTVSPRCRGTGGDTLRVLCPLGTDCHARSAVQHGPAGWCQLTSPLSSRRRAPAVPPGGPLRDSLRPAPPPHHFTACVTPRVCRLHTSDARLPARPVATAQAHTARTSEDAAHAHTAEALNAWNISQSLATPSFIWKADHKTFALCSSLQSEAAWAHLPTVRRC